MKIKNRPFTLPQNVGRRIENDAMCVKICSVRLNEECSRVGLVLRVTVVTFDFSFLNIFMPDYSC